MSLIISGEKEIYEETYGEKLLSMFGVIQDVDDCGINVLNRVYSILLLRFEHPPDHLVACRERLV